MPGLITVLFLDQRKNYGIKRKRQDMHKIIFLVRKLGGMGCRSELRQNALQVTRGQVLTEITDIQIFPGRLGN